MCPRVTTYKYACVCISILPCHGILQPRITWSFYSAALRQERIIPVYRLESRRLEVRKFRHKTQEELKLALFLFKAVGLLSPRFTMPSFLLNVWLDLQILWGRGGMMGRTTHTHTHKKMELYFPFERDSFPSLSLCSWVWWRCGWQCCSLWAGSPTDLQYDVPWALWEGRILDFAAVVLSICWRMACIDSLRTKPATQRVSGFPSSVITLLSSVIWHPRHHEK